MSEPAGNDYNATGAPEDPIAAVNWGQHGLAPAIVQDAATGEVLMLAYMNREALGLCLRTGETHFWSRSRQMLWHKGETSGNTQRIVEILYDCDADTLLIRVEPRGPACHTGRRSCFFRRLAWRLVTELGGD
jgi:phosphoribosyl-AMP cyclohydrolase